MTEQIEIERDIAASPEAVFDAWTTPESFAQWFGTRAVDVPTDRLDFVAEEGRPWSATMVLPDGNTIDWTGEFREVTRPARLEFTITDQPADPARAAVTVDLTETDEGTHLLMTQETPGFTEEQREGLIGGWNAFLDVLAEIAEQNGDQDSSREQD